MAYKFGVVRIKWKPFSSDIYPFNNHNRNGYMDQRNQMKIILSLGTNGERGVIVSNCMNSVIS